MYINKVCIFGSDVIFRHQIKYSSDVKNKFVHGSYVSYVVLQCRKT